MRKCNLSGDLAVPERWAQSVLLARGSLRETFWDISRDMLESFFKYPRVAKESVS